MTLGDVSRTTSGETARIVDVDRIRHYFQISIQILSTFRFRTLRDREHATPLSAWLTRLLGIPVAGSLATPSALLSRLAFRADFVDRLNEIRLNGGRGVTCTRLFQLLLLRFAI